MNPSRMIDSPGLHPGRTPSSAHELSRLQPSPYSQFYTGLPADFGPSTLDHHSHTHLNNQALTSSHWAPAVSSSAVLPYPQRGSEPRNPALPPNFRPILPLSSHGQSVNPQVSSTYAGVAVIGNGNFSNRAQIAPTATAGVFASAGVGNLQSASFYGAELLHPSTTATCPVWPVLSSWEDFVAAAKILEKDVSQQIARLTADPSSSQLFAFPRSLTTATVQKFVDRMRESGNRHCYTLQQVCDVYNIGSRSAASSSVASHQSNQAEVIPTGSLPPQSNTPVVSSVDDSDVSVVDHQYSTTHQLQCSQPPRTVNSTKSVVSQATHSTAESEIRVQSESVPKVGLKPACDACGRVFAKPGFLARHAAKLCPRQRRSAADGLVTGSPVTDRAQTNKNGDEATTALTEKSSSGCYTGASNATGPSDARIEYDSDPGSPALEIVECYSPVNTQQTEHCQSGTNSSDLLIGSPVIGAVQSERQTVTPLMGETSNEFPNTAPQSATRASDLASPGSAKRSSPAAIGSECHDALPLPVCTSTDVERNEVESDLEIIDEWPPRSDTPRQEGTADGRALCSTLHIASAGTVVADPVVPAKRTKLTCTECSAVFDSCRTFFEHSLIHQYPREQIDSPTKIKVKKRSPQKKPLLKNVDVVNASRTRNLRPRSFDGDIKRFPKAYWPLGKYLCPKCGCFLHEVDDIHLRHNCETYRLEHPVECEYCSIRFESQSDLKLHALFVHSVEHPELDSAEREQHKQVVSEILAGTPISSFCPVCWCSWQGKTSETKRFHHFERHNLVIQQRMKWIGVCPVCHLICPDMQSMLFHKRKVHFDT